MQLGTVVGVTPVVFVTLIVDGHDIVLTVPLSRFFWSEGIRFVPLHGSADLIFESPGCTGAPFLPNCDWVLTKPAAIVQPGMGVRGRDRGSRRPSSLRPFASSEHHSALEDLAHGDGRSRGPSSVGECLR